MSEEKDLDLLFDNNEVATAGFWGRACSRLSNKNTKLELENKRLREALEKIVKSLDTIIRVDNLKQADDALSVELVYMQNIAIQALAPQEPQEKTFTYFEIRDILNGVLLDYLDKPSVDTYRLDVLKKFEKAADNEQ